MGAIGIQMGTRMIATKESDFAEAWKEILVSATEEDTLVARGFFGPCASSATRVPGTG